MSSDSRIHGYRLSIISDSRSQGWLWPGSGDGKNGNCPGRCVVAFPYGVLAARLKAESSQLSCRVPMFQPRRCCQSVEHRMETSNATVLGSNFARSKIMLPVLHIDACLTWRSCQGHQSWNLCILGTNGWYFRCMYFYLHLGTNWSPWFWMYMLGGSPSDPVVWLRHSTLFLLWTNLHTAWRIKIKIK